jgi:hypothetical protein
MERKISKLVALFPVMQLEKLTDLYFKLFPQTGYHVSANDHFFYKGEFHRSSSSRPGHSLQ